MTDAVAEYASLPQPTLNTRDHEALSIAQGTAKDGCAAA
jgi:hypothetical protein